MAPKPPSQLPRRLADLSTDTIEWLARLNRKELDNLIVLCRANDEQLSNFAALLDLSEGQRAKWDKLVGMREEEIEAVFAVATTVIRLRWVGIKGVWLIVTVASVIIAWSQVSAAISKWMTKQ